MPNKHNGNRMVGEVLLAWYREDRRSLPWRDEEDAYPVWVSEVMLQQTRVETVIPYYRRWLERFPTVHSVATSSLDEALKVWEGLGYYSRCRNFHRACQIVDKEYGGEVPSRWEEFRQLPGVGDYTAAAVLSFAFGREYPVLDGNVSRVMSRLLAFTEPVSKGKKIFLKKLNEWLDRDRPGEFNQAIMELGSLICRTNQPHCLACPLADICQGYRKGMAETLPVRPVKKHRPHRRIVVGVIWKDGKFLIQKRPEEGLLGGLWELPGGKVMRGESMESALVRETGEETGLLVEVGKLIGAVNHAYTHFSITFNGYHCSVLDVAGKRGESDIRWIFPEEIVEFAFSRANHKLFDVLCNEGWKPQ